jgi:flagellar export protein FliJ
MMDGKDFYVIKDYLTFLESKKLELEEKRAELGRKVGIIKSELLELMKEVKILEKLQSKALSLLKKMDNRRQQKALDAIALRRDEASLTP